MQQRIWQCMVAVDWRTCDPFASACLCCIELDELSVKVPFVLSSIFWRMKSMFLYHRDPGAHLQWVGSGVGCDIPTWNLICTYSNKRITSLTDKPWFVFRTIIIDCVTTVQLSTGYTYVTWSRGISRMSLIFILSYRQKEVTNSNVLYCLEIQRFAHISGTRFRIVMGFGSK